MINQSQGEANPQTFIPRLAQLFIDGTLLLVKFVRVYDLEQINDTAAADSAAGRTVKPVLRMSR